MALTLSEKQVIVAKIAKVAANASSVVVADYCGLKVSEMTTLRQTARQVGVSVCVIKNSLSKRAFQGTSFECLADILTGSSCLAFSLDDPGAAARLFRDFSKTISKLKVKGVSLGGKVFSVEQLDLIANLPTRSEALSQLAYVFKAPIVRLAQTLKETQGKCVRTVAAIRDKKQAV